MRKLRLRRHGQRQENAADLTLQPPGNPNLGSADRFLSDNQIPYHEDKQGTVDRGSADVLYGDFDGDGRVDIAAYGVTGLKNCTQLLLSLSTDPNGSPYRQVDLPGDIPLCEVPRTYVADFTGDRRDDILIVALIHTVAGHCRDNSPILLLQSNGDGTFTFTHMAAPVGGYPGPVVQARAA